MTGKFGNEKNRGLPGTEQRRAAFVTANGNSKLIPVSRQGFPLVFRHDAAQRDRDFTNIPAGGGVTSITLYYTGFLKIIMMIIIIIISIYVITIIKNNKTRLDALNNTYSR